MTDRHRTVAEPFRHEIDKIKGSRFIASVSPWLDPDALQGRLADLRETFSDANHHCWAWRRGERFRYSDDGEPSGSAGRPILRQIDGRGLDRVTVIVTRIFGGTKLGVGGLVRAYGGAAAAALERARTVVVVRTCRVRFDHDYGLSPVVDALLRAWKLTPADRAFGASIQVSVDVPASSASAFAQELHNRSSGRIVAEVSATES